MKATEQRNKAIEVFDKYVGRPRFTKIELQKELNKINEDILKELSYPKDLRNNEYLYRSFLNRQYFKKLVSLF